jgi:hypothetical protein
MYEFPNIVLLLSNSVLITLELQLLSCLSLPSLIRSHYEASRPTLSSALGRSGIWYSQFLQLGPSRTK